MIIRTAFDIDNETLTLLEMTDDQLLRLYNSQDEYVDEVCDEIIDRAGLTIAEEDSDDFEVYEKTIWKAEEILKSRLDNQG